MRNVKVVVQRACSLALGHPVWAGISGIVGILGAILAIRMADFHNDTGKNETSNKLAALQQMIISKLDMTSDAQLENNTLPSYVRRHWVLSDVQQVASVDSFVSSVSPALTRYLQYQCRLIDGLIDLIADANPRVAVEREDARQAYRSVVYTYRAMLMKMMVVIEGEKLRQKGKLSDEEISFITEFPWDQIYENPSYIKILDAPTTPKTLDEIAAAEKGVSELRAFQQKYPRVLPSLKVYISETLKTYTTRHSVVPLSEEEKRRLRAENDARNKAEPVSGIGIILDRTENGLRIRRVMARSPAFRAGLIEGDIIVAVNEIPLSGADLEKAMDLIRGDPGTVVRLSVRTREKKLRRVEIERALLNP